MDNLAGYISSFGIIAVALLLLWKEYRSGTDKLDSKIKQSYETRIAQQDRELEEHKAREIKYQQNQGEMKKAIATMKEEFAAKFGEMKGEISAKDKQIKDLTDTILNRNPDLEKLLAEIRDFMENIHKQNLHQTSILEAGSDRNDRIDEATAKEEGHVLRDTPQVAA
jgi:flagellar biosynthesis/type III secretory pathway chaperone